MTKWVWVAVLVVQAHFGASYLVGIERNLGLFNYIWPWATGDHGLLGTHPNLLGIALGPGSALLSILSILAIFGVWLPHDSWRALAIAATSVQLLLMVGYFGSTKILPIVYDLAVIAAVWTNSLPLKQS